MRTGIETHNKNRRAQTIQTGNELSINLYLEFAFLMPPKGLPEAYKIRIIRPSMRQSQIVSRP